EEAWKKITSEASLCTKELSTGQTYTQQQSEEKAMLIVKDIWRNLNDKKKAAIFERKLKEIRYSWKLIERSKYTKSRIGKRPAKSRFGSKANRRRAFGVEKFEKMLGITTQSKQRSPRKTKKEQKGQQKPQERVKPILQE
ncbi:5224_t:CDS:2, partial [Gigaspora rosea]